MNETKEKTKVGMLYGCELLIDTTDEKIVKHAIAFLERASAALQTMEAQKQHEEDRKKFPELYPPYKPTHE